MIITLLFFGLFIISTLLIILANIIDNIYSKKHDKTSTYSEIDELNKTFIGKCYKIFWKKMDYTNLSIIASFAFGALLVISIILIVCAHIAPNKNIEINKIDYDSLCQRLEIVNSDYEDVSKSDVIKDIAEWNKTVLDTKYWAKNPWTSWFYSQKIVDELKYIDY